MFLLWRSLLFVLGATVVWLTLRSAIRTYLLPRAAPDPIARLAFVALRRVFTLVMLPLKTYRERDRVLAYYSPLGMLMLLAVWLTLVLLGYTCMFWAIGVESGLRALALSGSSLFTLGYEPVDTLPQKILTFTEAFVGPVLIALLIGYMPTIYGAFSKREALVNLLEVRAGSPPSAVGMITRYHRLNRLASIGEMWLAWETWFSELEETHTSLAMLSFFRSPVPEHHWVSAAGAVLDAAALVLSTVDLPFDVQSALCVRGGYIALRRIADYFQIPYNPDPRPDDAISLTRPQFDHAYDLLALEGVPLLADRDQAWRDFAGWRVNYDAVLLALARLTMATPAPWSSPDMPDQIRLPEAGRDS